MDFTEAFDALSPTLPPGQDIDHQRDLWLRTQCDELPERIRFQAFEIAVRHGFDVALELLHHAADDGITGPVALGQASLVKLTGMDIVLLRMRLTGAWFGYVFKQPGWRSSDNLLVRRMSIYLMSI